MKLRVTHKGDANKSGSSDMREVRPPSRRNQNPESNPEKSNGNSLWYCCEEKSIDVSETFRQVWVANDELAHPLVRRHSSCSWRRTLN